MLICPLRFVVFFLLSVGLEDLRFSVSVDFDLMGKLFGFGIGCKKEGKDQ
jgi:hypothetical protein